MKLLTSALLLGACFSIPYVNAEVDSSSGSMSVKERAAQLNKEGGKDDSSASVSMNNSKKPMSDDMQKRLAMFNKSGSDNSSSSSKDSSNKDSSSSVGGSSISDGKAMFEKGSQSNSSSNNSSSSSSDSKPMGSDDKSGNMSLADRVKNLEAAMQNSNNKQSSMGNNDRSGGVSLADRKNAFEAAVQNSNKPSDKVAIEVTDELGRITKRCEDSERAKAYNQIVKDCNDARKDGKFDDYYRDTYEKAWGNENDKESPGLKNLRDLGRYSPNADKNEQVKLTKANMGSKGEPLKKLSKDAPAEDFAEQLSIVHPSNDPVFKATMKCVADARGWAAEDTN